MRVLHLRSLVFGLRFVVTLELAIICDFRCSWRARLPINSQRLTDSTELTLVYGQFKQKTCLYTLFQLKISLRPQPNVYQ